MVEKACEVVNFFEEAMEKINAMPNDRQWVKWIDYMKVYGLYFLVLGHFFSHAYIYIYTFSVPVFFCISGFLSKKEDNHSLFWKKIFYNLLLPMVIICSINFLCNLFWYDAQFSIKLLRRFLFYLFIGMWSSTGVCWFVYTLVTCKILFQYLNRFGQWIVAVLFICLAVVYNTIDFADYGYAFVKWPNAIIDVFLAYPFFMIGSLLRPYRDELNKLSSVICIGMFLLMGTVVYFCGYYNGMVNMYMCSYGRNILLFFVGGIAGTVMLYALSKLTHGGYKYVKTISIGSIIILGFHGHFINTIRIFFSNPCYLDFLFAFLILVLFIPIILLSSMYFPCLIGKMRVNKQ